MGAVVLSQASRVGGGCYRAGFIRGWGPECPRTQGASWGASPISQLSLVPGGESRLGPADHLMGPSPQPAGSLPAPSLLEESWASSRAQPWFPADPLAWGALLL